MIARTARALADGKAIGWFQGRMEFGPRALGGRSILGDARSPTMQKLLNLKVKYRESFRPFAPSVLREKVSDWFDLDCDSPYMLLVAGVREDRRRAMSEAEQALFGIDKLNIARSEIPAVTHVDYSARIQTVHRETNPRYHALIEAFEPLDRLPGHRQYQLQRARRADRLHAGRCISLLHGHRHRRADRRRFLAREGGPGSFAQAQLQGLRSSSTDQVTDRHAQNVGVEAEEEDQIEHDADDDRDDVGAQTRLVMRDLAARRRDDDVDDGQKQNAAEEPDIGLLAIRQQMTDAQSPMPIDMGCFTQSLILLLPCDAPMRMKPISTSNIVRCCAQLGGA